MSHSKSDLSIYRLERARQDLKAAKKLLDANDTYKASVNRSYYAIFHAIRALLAIDGIDFKKHSAIISYFRKEYVKSGKFDMSIQK
jgi:uncharacterized protein (UPF0332 family)